MMLDIWERLDWLRQCCSGRRMLRMASPSGVSLADTERHDVESGESWRQPLHPSIGKGRQKYLSMNFLPRRTLLPLIFYPSFVASQNFRSLTLAA
jgi:hypothetical protein